jgi:hypothetical protein
VKATKPVDHHLLSIAYSDNVAAERAPDDKEHHRSDQE